MIPSAHDTPEAMARCLVSYIACDRKVRSHILSEFHSAPSLQTIARIRAVHQSEVARLRRGKLAPGYTAKGFDWRGDRLRADMDIVSRVFVRAIERERKYFGAY